MEILARDSGERKIKKPRLHLEDDMQTYFFHWFALAYPYVEDVSFSSQSGAKRTIRQGKRLKRAGMKKGVLDVIIPYPSGRYHGMFIEFKVKPNKPTKEQLNMIERHTKNGYYCAVCYSWLEASEVVKWYIHV